MLVLLENQTESQCEENKAIPHFDLSQPNIIGKKKPLDACMHRAITNSEYWSDRKTKKKIKKKKQTYTIT